MDILSIVLIFVWLGGILWLANLADRLRDTGDLTGATTLSFLAYGLIALTLFLTFFAGLLMQLGGFFVGPGAGPSQRPPPEATGGLDPSALGPIGLSLWAPSLLGLVLLLKPVRVLLARILPVDPGRTVHAVALSFIALIVMNLLFTLGIGLDNLADMMEANAEAGIAFNPTSALWAQDIMMALLGVVGVGWLARRRTFRGALERLAIVMPTGRQALIGVGAALILVPIVLAIEIVAGRAGFGLDADVDRITEQMIGPLTRSVFGILTLGLAAALGEETIFRGALQPRFGLILTSLLFALLHSTYGLTLSTLLVFMVGVVLGLLRQRHNTTTSMITHAVYNMTLGLIAYLGLLENL